MHLKFIQLSAERDYPSVFPILWSANVDFFFCCKFAFI